MFFKPVTASLAALTLCSTAALADDIGKTEYMNACASCHGESGMGDGPLAELMTVPVPSLTTLSADNDGTFPMLDVIQFIDGRQGTRGHGYPMPIWGDRYRKPIPGEKPAMVEKRVRAQINALIDYLKSIQK